MLRDQVTITELELLCFMNKPRTAKELADYIKLSPTSVQIHTCRMNKKGLIDIEIPHWSGTTYKASRKGEAIINELDDLRFT